LSFEINNPIEILLSIVLDNRKLLFRFDSFFKYIIRFGHTDPAFVINRIWQHRMGIKSPTKLVSTAKIFLLVSGIVVEFSRDRRLAKLFAQST
jgi:hypothetical protein